MRIHIIIVLIAFFLSSCDYNKIYVRYKTVGVEPLVEWHNNHLVSFYPFINDTAADYIFKIAVRHMSGYKYTSLKLKIKMASPSGLNKIKTYNVKIVENNKYIGDVAGDLYDVIYVAEENMHFDESGEYNFIVAQDMRTEYINGIVDIGIIIEKKEKK